MFVTLFDVSYDLGIPLITGYFISIVVIILVMFYGSVSDKPITDLPLGIAFHNPLKILITLYCSVSTSVSVIFDIIFELYLTKTELITVQLSTVFERGSLVLLNVISGVVLIYFMSSDHIARIFATVHLLQSSGSLGTVILLLSLHFSFLIQ